MHHIEFDTTIDEIVDVNMRLVQNTATFRRRRREWQWSLGVCLAGGFIVALLRNADFEATGLLTFTVCAAVVAGILGGYAYGRYHDATIRSSYAQLMRELYGNTTVVHWRFQVREDALWVHSPHAQISYPWSQLTRVEEHSGLIELWFPPGLAVVRNRAFHSDLERVGFLKDVRQRLLHKNPESGPHLFGKRHGTTASDTET